MTTIAITSASVGIIIAEGGVLSALRFLVSGGGQYEKLVLADNAASLMMASE
jgi:hypothetical protein